MTEHPKDMNNKIDTSVKICLRFTQTCRGRLLVSTQKRHDLDDLGVSRRSEYMRLPAGKKWWFVQGALVLLGAVVLPTLLLTRFRLRMNREQPLPMYGRIADFSLVNQNGNPVSLANLRGHVWVADIIFTRCASSCPQMTYQMEALQQALSGDSQVKLVTLTTDPDFDTAPVLKRYAERFNADPNRWVFLTGTKQQIANLAVGSLKLSAVPTNPTERVSPADLFVHSTIFVVVGKHGQVRGIFETTGNGVDPRHVNREILGAVNRLERET